MLGAACVADIVWLEISVAAASLIWRAKRRHAAAENQRRAAARIFMPAAASGIAARDIEGVMYSSARHRFWHQREHAGGRPEGSPRNRRRVALKRRLALLP